MCVILTAFENESRDCLKSRDDADAQKTLFLQRALQKNGNTMVKSMESGSDIEKTDSANTQKKLDEAVCMGERHSPRHSVSRIARPINSGIQCT